MSARAWIRVVKWFGLGIALAIAGLIDQDGGLMLYGTGLLLTGIMAILAEAKENLGAN